MSRLISIAGDQRGESALVHLPVRAGPREEVLIEARSLRKIDAFTAVALRAAIEYHARRCQQLVTFRPPHDAQTWSLLSTLMGTDLPRHFCLARDTSPPAQCSRAAVLPCQRVDNLDVLDILANGLPDVIGTNYGRRHARLLAGAFGTLVENAVVHASESPIGALAAIAYDREADTLQLVVADLGRGLADADDPEDALISLVERSVEHRLGLTGLIDDAQRKGIELELRIASSSARLSWRGAVPEVSTGQAVAGFTAATILHLDQ